MTPRPHVVYDGMIYLQAAVNLHRMHTTMRWVNEGSVVLFTSPEIEQEIQEVLLRSTLRTRFPSLTPERVQEFISHVFSKAKRVDVVPRVFHIQRDKEDEPYLNLAIAVRPSYLVTWNHRHLTYLMRQDTPEGLDFCTRFPDVTILSPPDFIKQLRTAAG